MLAFPFLCNSFLLQGFYNCHILSLLSFLGTYYHFTLRYQQKSNIFSMLLSTSAKSEFTVSTVKITVGILYLPVSRWTGYSLACWSCHTGKFIKVSSLRRIFFFLLFLFHRPLLWFKLCSSKTPVLKPWHLVSQNIAVFRDRALREVVKWK